MPQKDAVEKTLFCYNDVFSDICNAIIFDGKPKIQPSDLTDAVSSSSYKFADKVRSQDRDVAKFWKNGQICLALVGIENQTSYDPDMPLRIISYDAAAYRTQLSEKKRLKRGENRYPIVTFILNFSTRQRWKNKNLLKRVKVPKELRPFVSDYKINVIDLAWLDDTETSRFHGEIRFIIDYLSAQRRDAKFKPSEEMIRHYDEIIQLLSLLSHAQYADTAEMFAEEKKQKEAIPVSKFMTKLFADAKAEGKTEGTLSTLYGLVKDGILSAQQAAQRMNMPVEEFQRRANALKAGA